MSYYHIADAVTMTDYKLLGSFKLIGGKILYAWFISWYYKWDSLK